MNWVEEAIQDYYKWLINHTSVRTTDTDWFAISTPYVGLFNDIIEFYVKRDGRTTIFSDDGVTINNLELLGVNIEKSKIKKEVLNSILFNYGVSLQGKELISKLPIESFSQQKHNFISAIMEISDMYVAASSSVISMFNESVKQFLDEKEIIYTPQFIAKGASGIDFNFDYQIAGRESEIIIKSFNSLSKQNIPSFLYSINDVSKLRNKNTGKNIKGLAFINDIDKEIKPEFLNAILDNNSNYILWSNRDSEIAKLYA